jgi:hypothetical protein
MVRPTDQDTSDIWKTLLTVPMRREHRTTLVNTRISWEAEASIGKSSFYGFYGIDQAGEVGLE